MPVSVKVEVITRGATPPGLSSPDWEMVFTFTTEDGLTGNFTVLEPYMVSLKKWQKMANGVIGHYNFYQGNDEGSISIKNSPDTDPIMLFLGYCSGAGGDVSCGITIPHCMVKLPLQVAIDNARELGYLN